MVWSVRPEVETHRAPRPIRLATGQPAGFEPLCSRRKRYQGARKRWSRLFPSPWRGTRTSALFDELCKKAGALSIEERALPAQELLDPVERDSDRGVKAAREWEIASRIARYERGEARLVSADEVFAAARRITG
ncbi:MAG: addiction module protein [Rhodocyclaceae bacterium]|nr:addiction module protein [Rhodocyclaceae bacterium]